MNLVNRKIKVMVVDDHEILRETLILLLNSVPEFTVIGGASNGKEALSILEEYEPHVILLDIDMPVMNGRETLTTIKKLYPNIKIIMLTMYCGMGYELEYINLGAHSFLTKNTNSHEIIKAIKIVHSERYSYYIANQKDNGLQIHSNHLQLSLSEREKQILKLACENKTNVEISHTLQITENTVRFHRKNIYSKTRTNSLLDLIKYSLRNGIISF